MGEFQYFYAPQAEQFSFYIVPSRLFTDSRFFDLSAEAKILYSIMLDRMKLSVKNNWVDDKNRVYIVFKVEEVTQYINCGKNKAIKLLQELTEWKLIRRDRTGDRRYPALTYVMNFTDYLEQQEIENATECDEGCNEKVKEAPVKAAVKETEETDKNATQYEHEKRSLKIKPSLERGLKNKPSEVSKSNLINHTKYNHNNIYNKSNLIESIKKQIDYDVIRDRIEAGEAEGSVEMLDDILQAMVNMSCFCHARDTIRIASADMPSGVVESQFAKINMEHVLFVLDGLRRTKKKLRNPSAVISTALYNAVGSLNTFYDTEARIDMENYHRRE